MKTAGASSYRRTDIHAVLQPGQDGPEAWAAKVSKAVYASPMNVQVRWPCSCVSRTIRCHGSSHHALFHFGAYLLG